MMATAAPHLPDASKVKSPLLDQVRRAVRVRHYSIRTERAYADWVYRFIRFHNRRHPRELGPREINQFLSHLASDLNVAASTQNQALNALVFLYPCHGRRRLRDQKSADSRAQDPGRATGREDAGRIAPGVTGGPSTAVRGLRAGGEDRTHRSRAPHPPRAARESPGVAPVRRLRRHVGRRVLSRQETLMTFLPLNLSPYSFAVISKR